jgi:hypothetical protein
MTEEELAPMAVVIAVAVFLLIAIAVLAVICCQQRRRRSLLTATKEEPQKANNKLQPANFRGKDDIQIAVNKMEDLLQHNTQQLLQGACANSNLYVESGHNNEYEVPHNERSCYGYYDLRDVVGRSAALR